MKQSMNTFHLVVTNHRSFSIFAKTNLMSLLEFLRYFTFRCNLEIRLHELIYAFKLKHATKR